MGTAPHLSGRLRVVPEPRHDLLEIVTAEYATLTDSIPAEDVLVLKRHPAGLECLRSRLAEGRAVPPRVASLPEHASRVIEEHDPTLERLGYEERIELISLVIEGSDGLPPYLEQARRQEPFVRDVGQLLLEATRQRVATADDEHLAACYRVMERFHEVLEERGYVERPAIIPSAVDLLEGQPDLRDRVTDAFDAVLAVEFEEYRALDRRYLAALTREATLVCLGERHASVHRSAVEPGRLEDLAPGLSVEIVEPPSSDPPAHAPVTRFLATGTRPRSGGVVHRIEEPTRRAQDGAVAAEIDALTDRGWDPGDVVVAVPRVERIPETRRRLRAAGVPTDALGTDALVADPVVNELYAVVTLCADGDRAEVEREERTTASERVTARVEQPGPLLESIEGLPARQGLERWVTETDLKGRVATAEEWVDAREQFASVRRVLEIASFAAETDLVAGDWVGLRRMLRRTIEYDAPHVHSVETSPPSGGVSVAQVADLAYDHRPVVFVLDLLERSYPGRPRPTQLFPTAWVREMDAFPAVTDPDAATITETFATAADQSAGDPLERYHTHRLRRLLALGCRAATERLYWCTYERESSGLRRTHAPSRFIELSTHAGVTVEHTDRATDLRGRQRGTEAALAEPWSELDRILGAATVGETADLRDTEALLQELAVLIEEESLDPALVEALRTQFEFAAGEVLRE